MITKIYAVFDQKALMYTNPMIYQNEAVAIREFAGIANDPESRIGKNPEDYSLCEIGEYNDVSGILMPIDSPKTVGKAVQYIGRPSDL